MSALVTTGQNGAGGTLGNRIAQWWGQPDHFDWLSDYLNARGLSIIARRGMAVVSASLVFYLVYVLWGAPRDYGRLAVSLGWLAAAIGVGFAVLWTTRWPTRRQSIVFAIGGNAMIAVGCLTQPVPLVGLVGCTGLAVVGGYIAFFHTPGYMVSNFVMTAATGLVAAIRLANDGEGVLALMTFWLVIELNVIVPLAIQTVVHALGIDLVQSDRDPLTGLHNRRALYRHMADMLAMDAMRDAQLVVAMIDLDQFKVLNDSRGHSAGDEALVAVAGVLRKTCSTTAVLGRFGGEEFIIADTNVARDLPEFAESLCSAIAALPHAVTASVGTVSLSLTQLPEADPREAVADLIAAADAAMYVAKRNGGNQSCHHRVLSGEM